MRYFIFFALILCTVSCSHRSSYPIGGDYERTPDSFEPVDVLIPNAVDAISHPSSMGPAQAFPVVRGLIAMETGGLLYAVSEMAIRSSINFLAAMQMGRM
jgi:hypothetical protein